MQSIRHRDERGQTAIDWLQSWHSFSFGEYHDPDNMGFGPLRVINEDIVKAGSGFDTHGHRDMEIITYILSGALEHKDSLGNGGVIRPGEVQVMSAGKGILHSEFNPSPNEDTHLLQIWIRPSETGTRPGYQQQAFEASDLQDKLRLVVSNDGQEGSLVIKQDAKLWAGRVSKGKSVTLDMDGGRKYWFQIARGQAAINGRELKAGDALGLENETGKAEIKALEDLELLAFELPR